MEIHDNILVAHVILNFFSRKSNKKGYMTIKLDMEKAYDKLELHFIHTCLRNLGLREVE